MSNFDIARYKANEERKSALREVNKIPYEIRQEFLRVLSVNFNRSDMFRTCITCEHFKEPVCEKFNQQPPARIIADGCEGYEDYEVPF